ncbi:hypothetical protein PFISCL1PPCAC_25348, partial [Pristionchus fissidentatus]
QEDNFGYLAKIKAVEISADTGHRRYHVHYLGWNNRYDCWIEHEDVAEYLYKHSPLVEAHHKMLLEQKNEAITGKKSTEGTPSMKKRKSERGISVDSSVASQKSAKLTISNDVEIKIPDNLRGLLLDDNDLVSRQFKLAKLPARNTVDDIIKEYIAEKEQEPSTSDKGPDYVETSNALADYFNILLGSQLLYKTERAQYTKACVHPAANAPGKRVDEDKKIDMGGNEILPSSLYGVPHLIRLFIKLGPLLVMGKHNEKKMKAIGKQFDDFLKFLSKNARRFHNLKVDYAVTINATRDEKMEE